MAETRHLFSTPFVIDTLRSPEGIAHLKNLIMAEKARDQAGVQIPNIGGWHSNTQMLEWGGEAARALALNPKLIIADEAVSALDVSVQAQVLNLMMELQAEMGISYLFISHDMAVVERVSHTVGVMYLGRVVELGPRSRVFENPQHPYTQALMSAVPIADPRRRKDEKDLNFKPIPSPIHPADYAPEPSVYREVEPGHLILETDSGY